MSLISMAQVLISNGYNVVPLYKDSKGNNPPSVPLKKADGGLVEYTEDDAIGWKAKYPSSPALALLPAVVNNVMGLDFDIPCVSIAKKIRNVMKKNFPDALFRDCNAPKFAVFFRGDESMMKISTANSKVYMIDGKENQIEVMANSAKSLTMVGTHRKTRKVYRYGQKRSPFSVHSSELPELSLKNVASIIAAFHEAVEASGKRWEITAEHRFGRIGKGVGGGTLKKSSFAKNYSERQVMDALTKFDPTNRDDWLHAGRALHDYYEGVYVGFLVWAMWSRLSDKYDESMCELKWSEFQEGGGQSMATLVKATGAEAYKSTKPRLIDAIDSALLRYVFIKEGSLVGDRDLSSGESLSPWGELNLCNRNETVVVPNAKGEPKLVPVMTLWQEHPDRTTVQGVTFNPSANRVCEHDDPSMTLKYWNTYIRPPWHRLVAGTNQKMIDVFKGHIQYLFGDDDQGVVWFTTWLAQLIQDPSNRQTVTPLHVSTRTRTGRGWLSEVIRTLVGTRNSSEADISRLTSEGAWGGFMENTTYCSIPETRQSGKKRFSTSENMKKNLTDEYLNLNVKFGSDALRRIYVRFWLQSNHTDAIVLDASNERINVFSNHKPPRPKAYYSLLYTLKNSKKTRTLFFNSIYTYLMDYKVDLELLNTHIMTTGEQAMLSSTKSPLASAYIAFKNVVSLYTTEMRDNFITQYLAIHESEELAYSWQESGQSELSHLEREYVISSGTKYHVVMNTLRAIPYRAFVPISAQQTDITRPLEIANKQCASYFEMWKDKKLLD